MAPRNFEMWHFGKIVKILNSIPREIYAFKPI